MDKIEADHLEVDGRRSRKLRIEDVIADGIRQDQLLDRLRPSDPQKQCGRDYRAAHVRAKSGE